MSREKEIREKEGKSEKDNSSAEFDRCFRSSMDHQNVFGRHVCGMAPTA